ncbi:phenylalanyl-tRNA synthetase beta chain [Methylopila capsulata]|uniref:Phenylalanine--tRNA ligase beta subunit n=1 Tax=Methylopila capsulata TaxID=61654 RepID=A0A9W6MQS9_9HYPH|nr:phenylalanine--tRNA ligase subunit beta [Methylopila capsulata]MBM7851935.1 phenylalanyl-tRNA synthetase beta chain [Methylopila capsulata]GLK55000.1 phenylalanine--tRNA ligase beta subunit [Methylopila capsulata]
MKFSLSWLKEHLAGDADLVAVTETLTRVGLEVEHVEDKAGDLSAFVVGHILDAQRHPNADKLQVCSVDVGKGAPLQVVCGAPNARAGLKVVFAAPGTVIPASGVKLGASEIRGVASGGMLCSSRELGLGDEHDGIMELPADAPVGRPFAPLVGLDDPVIEIAVTPNRPDCLGVHGVARDLAAAEIGELIEPPARTVRGAFPCPTAVRFDFGDAEPLSPFFALRLVRGVRNGPSPEWLQRKLKSIGQKPINALVDVTNYLTFDRGRPLHVFDAAKVRGDLVVRRARAGESVVALDGKTYALDETMCVIADDGGVQSIAGVMGGAATGCDASTTDVLVESALWDALNIARTGRSLNVHSDARHRFERGVDPAFALPGLELATQLIIDICGGEASEIVTAGEVVERDLILEFPVSEVKRLAGLAVTPAEVKVPLHRLGFWVTGQGELLKVAVPSWRPDVSGKADIVEEVVRIIGLDRVQATPLPAGASVGGAKLSPVQRRARTARRTLAARGMVEAVTWSFVSKAQADGFGGSKPELALANPIAADLSDMRPSLLPGLIAAAQRNADRGLPDVALFEVGQVFWGDRPEDQKIAATGLRRGTAKARGAGRQWGEPTAAVDAFDAKGDALAVLASLGLQASAVQIAQGSAPAWFHPGRSAALQLGPKVVLGAFGELHPRTLAALGVSGPLVGFELILDALPQPKAKPTRAKPPFEGSAFQPLSRDFAFVVDRDVAAGELIRAAQAAERKLVTRVDLFDRYEGPGVPEGKVSLGLAVTLQPREKTLTDAEIEEISARIVAQVAKATGATLRG